MARAPSLSWVVDGPRLGLPIQGQELGRDGVPPQGVALGVAVRAVVLVIVLVPAVLSAVNIVHAVVRAAVRVVAAVPSAAVPARPRHVQVPQRPVVACHEHAEGGRHCPAGDRGEGGTQRRDPRRPRTKMMRP